MRVEELELRISELLETRQALHLARWRGPKLAFLSMYERTLGAVADFVAVIREDQALLNRCTSTRGSVFEGHWHRLVAGYVFVSFMRDPDLVLEIDPFVWGDRRPVRSSAKRTQKRAQFDEAVLKMSTELGDEHSQVRRFGARDVPLLESLIRGCGYVLRAVGGLPPDVRKQLEGLGKKKFVPTELQLTILEELSRHVYTAEGLAKRLNGIGFKQHLRTVTRALASLKEAGLVDNRRGLGYYRTDMPPKPVE